MTFASCTDWLDVNEDPNTPAQAAVSVKTDRKSTRLNSSHSDRSRMPSSA